MGTYQVTIHAYSSEPSDMQSDTEVRPYIWAIPPRYGDPSQSGLTAEVAADLDLVSVTFDLTE